MAQLRVYSRRWGHDDHYQIARIAAGWTIRHVAIGGACDRTGQPFLYDNFLHDAVKYPSGVAVALERLWDHADANNLTDAQLQPFLDQLGDWIEACERATPIDAVFGF